MTGATKGALLGIAAALAIAMTQARFQIVDPSLFLEPPWFAAAPASFGARLLSALMPAIPLCISCGAAVGLVADELDDGLFARMFFLCTIGAAFALPFAIVSESLYALLLMVAVVFGVSLACWTNRQRPFEPRAPG